MSETTFKTALLASCTVLVGSLVPTAVESFEDDLTSYVTGSLVGAYPNVTVASSIDEETTVLTIYASEGGEVQTEHGITMTTSSLGDTIFLTGEPEFAKAKPEAQPETTADESEAVDLDAVTFDEGPAIFSVTDKHIFDEGNAAAAFLRAAVTMLGEAEDEKLAAQYTKIGNEIALAISADGSALQAEIADAIDKAKLAASKAAKSSKSEA